MISPLYASYLENDTWFVLFNYVPICEMSLIHIPSSTFKETTYHNKKPQKSTLKTGHESYTREGLAESKEYQIFFLSQSIHLLLRSLVEQLLRILSP